MKKYLLCFLLVLFLLPACEKKTATTNLPAAQIGLIDEDYISKRWGEFRTLSQDYQKFIQESKDQPQEEKEKEWKQREETLLSKLRQAAEKVRKQQKLAMVINKNLARRTLIYTVVLYGGKDISSEVLDALNQ